MLFWEIDSDNNDTSLVAICKAAPLKFSITESILNNNMVYFKTNQKSLILMEGLNGAVVAGVSVLLLGLSIFLDESS